MRACPFLFFPATFWVWLWHMFSLDCALGVAFIWSVGHFAANLIYRDFPPMLFSKIFSLRLTSPFLLFFAAVLTCSARPPQANEFSNHTLRAPATTDQTYYRDAHPYLEEPLEQLIARVPELKTIQPAQNQQPLTTILENAAKQVDQFFSNIVDLTAHEQIAEERQDSRRNDRNRLQAEDSYLILRRGSEIWGRVTEYRVDSKGNPVEEIGLGKGYFDTSNFALNHILPISQNQLFCISASKTSIPKTPT